MSEAKPQRSGLSRIVYDHLVRPFVESSAPITHISWGAAIGMFVGMTPTFGIQMYLVTVIWTICRYLLRVRFNLPIAAAMVWVTNPITVLPIYYAFLLTGNLSLGMDFTQSLAFDEFREIFIQARAETATGPARWLYSKITLLFSAFGWPMVVGGLIWAVPLSVLTYPFTTFAMLKYRALIAQREGMTYGRRPAFIRSSRLFPRRQHLTRQVGQQFAQPLPRYRGYGKHPLASATSRSLCVNPRRSS